MPTLTLTTSAAQAQRIVAAVGRHLELCDASGNPRNATEEEVKDLLIRHLTRLVTEMERRQAIVAISVPDFGNIT